MPELLPIGSRNDNGVLVCVACQRTALKACLKQKCKHCCKPPCEGHVQHEAKLALRRQKYAEASGNAIAKAAAQRAAARAAPKVSTTTTTIVHGTAPPPFAPLPRDAVKVAEGLKESATLAVDPHTGRVVQKGRAKRTVAQSAATLPRDVAGRLGMDSEGNQTCGVFDNKFGDTEQVTRLALAGARYHTNVALMEQLLASTALELAEKAAAEYDESPETAAARKERKRKLSLVVEQLEKEAEEEELLARASLQRANWEHTTFMEGMGDFDTCKTAVKLDLCRQNFETTRDTRFVAARPPAYKYRRVDSAAAVGAAVPPVGLKPLK